MNCLVRVPGLSLERFDDLVSAQERHGQAFMTPLVVQKMLLFGSTAFNELDGGFNSSLLSG